MKLFILNKQDENLLNMLSETEGDYLLMQNAVYYLNKDYGKNFHVLAALEKGRKVFAIEQEVTKRGLQDKLVEGVELLTYEKLVEVLFSGYTVLNM